jgi:hypothetical protein
MRKLALAALLVFLGLPAGAARLPTGDFLNLPVDVRSLGLGEASQAIASGVAEVSVNPASINGVRAQEFYFTHTFMYAGIGMDYLAYALAADRHHFGLTYHHVGYGGLEGHDATGAPTGSFGPSDTAYGFTYGTTQGPLSLGATLKYIDSKIVDSARTTTFDVGGMYTLDEEWRLGLSVVNAGGGLKYEQESAPLPTRVAAGVGWRAAERMWLDLDVVNPIYTPAYVAVGTAYTLPLDGVGALSLRVGLNTKTPDLGALTGVKAGFGFRFKNLDVDYAFDAGGDIGDSHHLGIGYRFGKGKED